MGLDIYKKLVSSTKLVVFVVKILAFYFDFLFAMPSYKLVFRFNMAA